MTSKIFRQKFFRLTPSVYNGKVKACILDWSGTTVDAHVLAPAVVFVDAFKKHGVEITMQEARGPMGLRKDLHIKKILEIPEVRARWNKIKGSNPTPKDAENIFNDFVPMQIECLPKYSTLIPGVRETINRLKNDYNIKIGSTTGFTKKMVDVLLEKSKEHGYVPDTSVAGDEVANDMGVRPEPFMIYQNLLQLKTSPIQSVVKVDDTVSGVGEGLNAGCWAVGIAGLSNYTDIDSLEQWENMDHKERKERVDQSREILFKSGAHYVINDFTSLPDVIDDINIRLYHNEKP